MQTAKLINLVSSVDNESLILPELQRKFVWKKTNIINLFDSLFKGYPIGAVLIWRTISKKSIYKKHFKGQKSKVIDKGAPIFGTLLDGQQRLTSLRMVLSGDFPLFFHLVDSTFHPESKRVNRNHLYVSVSDVILDTIKDSYIHTKLLELQKNSEITSQQYSDANDNYRRLKEILNTEIPIIDYSNDSIKNSMHLFIRFNSGGVKLKRAELAMADLAITISSLISDSIIKLQNQLNAKDFSFGTTFLVACLAAVHNSKVRFDKLDGSWGEDKKKIKQNWSITGKAINKTVGFLSGIMLWESTTWLRSVNVLIPIVYVYAKNKRLTSTDEKHIKRWLALALLRGRYSGSSEAIIDKDLKQLGNNPNGKKLWDTLPASLKRPISNEELFSSRRSGPIISIYYSYLRNISSKDWLTNSNIDGSIAGHLKTLEVHHIFPKNVLKSTHNPSDINLFLNYTIISKDSNLQLLDDKPEEYFLRMRKDKLKKIQKEHCIPSDTKLYSLKSYKKFLKERKKLLSVNLNKYLNLK